MAYQIPVEGGRDNGPVPDPASVDLGESGATVTNLAPVAVFYRDEKFAATADADGSIAAAATATLYGQQYFLLASAATSTRAMLGVVPLPLSSETTSSLAARAANLDALITGTITRDANGAATSASVSWPDGATGTYTGTPSTTFPGAVDTYAVTHVLSGTTLTFTQPAVTRDPSTGAVTNRPAITVA